ncbi:hypothetical protein AFE02nite_00740 [Actinotalea fermentans]|uniref:Uncharacterized protein n=1 Tax=Actinotalea fermentans TaxID=43671 RepID=A0A511YT19_9CELL|nr:hypothetical protein AFE02nite_00740 [Actinotalea fermentans]
MVAARTPEGPSPATSTCQPSAVSRCAIAVAIAGSSSTTSTRVPPFDGCAARLITRLAWHSVPGVLSYARRIMDSSSPCRCCTLSTGALQVLTLPRFAGRTGDGRRGTAWCGDVPC